MATVWHRWVLYLDSAPVGDLQRNGRGSMGSESEICLLEYRQRLRLRGYSLRRRVLGATARERRIRFSAEEIRFRPQHPQGAGRTRHARPLRAGMTAGTRHAAAAGSADSSTGCEVASRVLSSTGRRHTLFTYCNTLPARSTSRPRPSSFVSCSRINVPSLRISTTDTRGAPKLYLSDSRPSRSASISPPTTLTCPFCCR